MDDIPKQELVEKFVCVEIEACLKGDDVQMTKIFNGDTNIHDDIKNVSNIGLLEESNDCEVKNNVVVEVEELRSMKPSKFSIDLNENFDSSVVCVDSVVRDCALPPIDKKNEKEEIVVDYVQSVPSSTSIIQLPPQSQLELVQLPHGKSVAWHTKSGIVERHAFISIGGGSKMNSSTSCHNKDLNVKLKDVKQKCLVRDNSPWYEFSSLKKSNLRTIKQSA
ncbi:hypothetical protein PIB30_088243 [Stylosanthes scabra]|uniref:Uncharacterized protein n=1 Tax=Stylosanthes scabra TaxID=79078 RepID=A0ABU6WWH1_9FABA|nr:hypothetical protein [Stylosanthes scabra]